MKQPNLSLALALLLAGTACAAQAQQPAAGVLAPGAQQAPNSSQSVQPDPTMTPAGAPVRTSQHPAQTDATPSVQATAKDGPPQPARNCIEVEVNGERVPDYNCLAALLAPTAPRPRPSSPVMGSEEIARRSPTALGLVTPTATRQRMGNTFGVSTMPQRPATPPPTLPAPPPQR